MTPVRMKGKITQIVHGRGFAFAVGEDGLSRFIHATGMRDRVDLGHLKKGSTVEFTPVEFSPDRLRGVDVVIIKSELQARDERTNLGGENARSER